MPVEPPPAGAVADVVRRALAEDRAREDATTAATVAPDLIAHARLIGREAGVACGLEVAAVVFAALDGRVALRARVAEGERFAAGAVLADLHGPARAILSGERTALNLAQRLSGIATLTRRYADAVAGSGCAILDTRKTTPGLRDLEKYAVRCGGGRNHRRDLAAMAMIKDNHREAIARQGGDLAGAVAAIRARAPNVPVEIEIDALDQLEEALATRPDWVLLDNMDDAELREAVAVTAGRARLEASGGVTLARAAGVAATGVDALSAGALTHSAPALDLSLDIAFAD